MSLFDNYQDVSHKSLDRIKNLGEVFTPEFYVEDMLNLLGKGNDNIWFDENVTFFEPCCGHGNIVVAIYKRRLNAIYRKVIKYGSSRAALHSVANAINNLWAIDIDKENISQCRSRVLIHTLDFLKEKIGISDIYKLIKQEKDFIVHLLCAIKRHIHENEALTALSTKDVAITNARKTKNSYEWFVKYTHNRSFLDLFKSTYSI